MLIGVILAVALQPAVGWLQRHRLNRILASLLVSFGTIAVLLGVVVVVAYPVVTQADDFIRELPKILEGLFASGGQLHFLETRFQSSSASARTPEQVTNVVRGNQDTIFAVVTTAASIVAATITILTIMVMMLIEGPRPGARS